MAQPKEQRTCWHCGKAYTPHWTDTHPNKCAICANPEEYRQFCASFNKATREAEARRGREEKRILRQPQL